MNRKIKTAVVIYQMCAYPYEWINKNHLIIYTGENLKLDDGTYIRGVKCEYKNVTKKFLREFLKAKGL